MTRIILFIFLISQPLQMAAQTSEWEEDNLHIIGNLKDYTSQEPITKGMVSVTIDDVVKNNLLVTDGSFELYLSMGGTIRLDFTCPSFSSKFIIIHTEEVPEVDRKAGFTMGPMTISLFEQLEGIDFSLFKQPLGIASYNTVTTQLEWDTAYSQNTSKEKEDFMRHYEQVQSEQVIASKKAAINVLVDQWHQAAATADEDVYFGSMAEDAIFLGTDKTERWEKKIFEEWAQPHFAKDMAWAFTPHDRVIYLYDDGKVAWFEELLDTWMGTCRGSGVVLLTKDGWKIQHYNLALLVDNDKMNKVIEVMEEK